MSDRENRKMEARRCPGWHKVGRFDSANLLMRKEKVL